LHRVEAATRGRDSETCGARRLRSPRGLSVSDALLDSVGETVDRVNEPVDEVDAALGGSTRQEKLLCAELAHRSADSYPRHGWSCNQLPPVRRANAWQTLPYTQGSSADWSLSPSHTN
jgi:hypothetical protein